jgi:hypothetical protein
MHHARDCACAGRAREAAQGSTSAADMFQDSSMRETGAGGEMDFVDSQAPVFPSAIPEPAAGIEEHSWGNPRSGFEPNRSPRCGLVARSSRLNRATAVNDPCVNGSGVSAPRLQYGLIHPGAGQELSPAPSGESKRQ